MRRDELGHLEHRHFVFLEDGLQLIVGKDISLVLGILQIMLFDVIPDALHDLAARIRPGTNDCLKLGAQLHRLE